MIHNEKSGKMGKTVSDATLAARPTILEKEKNPSPKSHRSHPPWVAPQRSHLGATPGGYGGGFGDGIFLSPRCESPTHLTLERIGGVALELASGMTFVQANASRNTCADATNVTVVL